MSRRFRPELLQAAMESRALTVRRLAEVSGVSTTTLTAALRGESIALRTIAAIGKALEEVPEMPQRELLAG